MISFEEASAIVLGQSMSLREERVSLSESPGRVLAEDIFTDIDFPPFNKSAVDGFACRMDDLAHPGDFRIVETIAAGKIPRKAIGRHECSKIMTGAMVPEGAGCVVMVEDSEMTGDGRVRFTNTPVSPNVCYRGEDLRAGDLVLEKGLKIKASHVAVLAGVGAAHPMVAALPRVAIISTGDELVEPSVKPGMSQIRNSNGWQLEAQLRVLPALAFNLGIARDEGTSLRHIIDLGLLDHDVVLLTGGVSMGEFDHVPGILKEAGVEILFEKVAIQPGKPTVFGRKGNTFVFGLPGNPVSSFVLFEILVKPFLNRMMGHTEQPVVFQLPMGVDYTRRRSDRKSMIPVVIRDGAVYPVEYHGSAHINAYTKAGGIMVVETGTTRITRGEQVHVRPL